MNGVPLVMDFGEQFGGSCRAYAKQMPEIYFRDAIKINLFSLLNFIHILNLLSIVVCPFLFSIDRHSTEEDEMTDERRERTYRSISSAIKSCST